MFIKEKLFNNCLVALDVEEMLASSVVLLPVEISDDSLEEAFETVALDVAAGAVSEMSGC